MGGTTVALLQILLSIVVSPSLIVEDVDVDWSTSPLFLHAPIHVFSAYAVGAATSIAPMVSSTPWLLVN